MLKTALFRPSALSRDEKCRQFQIPMSRACGPDLLPAGPKVHAAMLAVRGVGGRTAPERDPVLILAATGWPLPVAVRLAFFSRSDVSRSGPDADKAHSRANPTTRKAVTVDIRRKSYAPGAQDRPHPWLRYVARRPGGKYDPNSIA